MTEDNQYEQARRNVDSILFKIQMQRQAQEEVLLERQREVVYGSYAVRFIYMDSETVFAFVKVPDLEELLAEEQRLGAEQAELDYYRDRYHTAYQNNLRHGDYFSVKTPTVADWGASHLTDMWPITQADYEAARANGWRMPQETLLRIMGEIADEVVKEGIDD